MTLDEAIKHCKEKAKELSDKAYEEYGISITEEEAYNCNECAREHEQLSRWLEDYKRLLEEKRPHGKWIMQPKFCRRACSHCKKAFRTSFAPANFCPNCGASMTDEVKI